MEWEAARDACAKEGGRLAQIFNADIQQKIADLTMPSSALFMLGLINKFISPCEKKKIHKSYIYMYIYSYSSSTKIGLFPSFICFSLFVFHIVYLVELASVCVLFTLELINKFISPDEKKAIIAYIYIYILYTYIYSYSYVTQKIIFPIICRCFL